MFQAMYSEPSWKKSLHIIKKTNTKGKEHILVNWEMYYLMGWDIS